MEKGKNQPVDSLTDNHRQSGILLHPTSLPSPYGIGDLGSTAYTFIDFLVETGQSLWQVLPLGPTGYGDSPYQSFSSFAGQPLLISPEKLIDDHLLTIDQLPTVEWESTTIDYGRLIPYKTDLLKTAFANFKDNPSTDLLSDLTRFKHQQAHWLDDYSLFMAIKEAHQGISWTEWPAEIAFFTPKTKKAWQTKLARDIAYYDFIQFLFYRQWTALKTYANQQGVHIIGDIPIFVAFDSADVWAHRDLYQLNTKGYPTHVAGVPPDYFSATGQLWGNPLYDWPAHAKTGYDWWIERIKHNLTLVDYLRIDHFRGFEGYWSIPYPAKTAVKGSWQKGPGKELFFALEKKLGRNLPIIAEDLGIITPAVEDLRDTFHFPGMKILQFAFETIEENLFLPHHYTPHSICYTGTHDNDTTLGWYYHASPDSQDKVRRYMNTDANDICWDFIRTCFSSVSEMAVVPFQDILSLDSDSRMNTPGVATGNWQWRYTESMITAHAKGMLAYTTRLFGRWPNQGLDH